jgi:hypothetical protein
MRTVVIILLTAFTIQSFAKKNNAVAMKAEESISSASCQNMKVIMRFLELQSIAKAPIRDSVLGQQENGDFYVVKTPIEGTDHQNLKRINFGWQYVATLKTFPVAQKKSAIDFAKDFHNNRVRPCLLESGFEVAVSEAIGAPELPAMIKRVNDLSDLHTWISVTDGRDGLVRVVLKMWMSPNPPRGND